jgi:hypothetical protein
MEIIVKSIPLEVELQWIINTNKKEIDRLRYYVERQQDFWEWYENTYDQTNNELWNEFEKWEDSQNRIFADNLRERLDNIIILKGKLSELASLKQDKPEKAVNFMQIRELTDEEWLKLPKEEILQLYKNCYAMLQNYIGLSGEKIEDVLTITTTDSEIKNTEPGKELFKKPTDKELVEIALLFNDGKIQKSKLRDMVAMSEFIIDRLYENGNISKPSSKE